MDGQETRTADAARVGGGDQELARRAAVGNEPALRTLLGRVTGKLRSIAWHMTYDFHDSQDLLQEALLKITTPAALTRYRGEGPLDAYLLNVGVRAMLSARRARRMAEWRAVEVGADLSEREAPVQPGSERTIDPTVRAAFEQLPERVRVLVLLITLGDYSYQEAADATGLPVGTVKSAYSRARATLRRALADRPADRPGEEVL